MQSFFGRKRLPEDRSSPSPDKRQRSTLLRQGYAHNSPILFATLGPRKEEFLDLFEACKNNFETPCEIITPRVCEDSAQAVYISKDRNSYLLGVFLPGEKSYHSSFKNVCRLLQEPETLVVFVCILGYGGERNLTASFIAMKQKLIRDTLQKKSDASFLNIGTVDSVSSHVSRAFSAFTFMSVYDLGAYARDFTEGVQGLLNPLEEASVRTFFPKHFPQVQVFVHSLRLIAATASSLRVLCRKFRQCIDPRNQKLLMCCFMMGFLALLLYPVFIVQFLASEAIYGYVLQLFTGNVFTLLGLQLVNILYKSSVPGSQESWRGLLRQVAAQCALLFFMFSGQVVPNDVVLQLEGALEACRVLFAKLQFNEGLLQVFSSLRGFIETSALMLDVRVFQECVVSQFTKLLEFLRDKVPESHFQSNGAINREALTGKMKYLESMYSIIQTVYEILGSIVLSLLDRLCPTVGSIDAVPQDATNRGVSPGTPHPVLQLLTNGGESNV